MGVSRLSLARHTCFIRELTYPTLDCLCLALDFIGVCSVHISLLRVCVIRESFIFFGVIVDSSAAPRHSRRLVRLPPSTCPPPLGERGRQSRWTTSYIDSHMMGDHEEGIPEPPSPI